MQPSTRARGKRVVYSMILVVAGLATIVTAARVLVILLQLLVAAIPLAVAAVVAVVAIAQLRNCSVATVCNGIRRSVRRLRTSFGPAPMR